MATEHVADRIHLPLTETPEVLGVLEALTGEVIERNILDFARSFGGRPIQGTPQSPERYAVTRLALSPEELRTKHYLAEQLLACGMQVEDHPLGLIGTYAGTDPHRLPVAIGSHYDSVPEGGMYDGAVGVMTSLQIVREMNKCGLRFPRGIKTVFFTGEESARFDCALYGSKGMTEGLDEATLAMQKPGDVTIGEAICAQGYELDQVRTPVITPENTACFVELHVDQSGDLEKQHVDFAIVEAVAGPDRKKLIIGTELKPDTTDLGITRHFQMNVLGIADHSGATPMGEKYRADGLAASAEIIKHIARVEQELSGNGRQVQISIGAVNIKSGAMNKVPGLTTTDIRITGADQQEVEKVIGELQRFIRDTDIAYHSEKTRFASMKEADRMNLTETHLSGKPFYNPSEMANRHELAADIVQTVQYVTTGLYMGQPVVGTVGTFTVDQGKIILGVDIRGIDPKMRSTAVALILRRIQAANKRNQAVPMEIEELPGSLEPVKLDEHIVSAASEAISSFKIGTHMVDYSRAGHDTMNMQRAGIPSAMIFIPSSNGGVSHNPNEYTTAEALGKGAQALAATIFSLAER